MTSFEKLERKFGRYAIRDLMRYFTVLYAIGFVISIWQPMLSYQYLALDPNAILQHLVSSGQVSQNQINKAFQMGKQFKGM